MIVYHGSNSNFKKLRLSKSLVRTDSKTMENEGLGIYFSTDINTARSYGKYVYVLEINDSYLYDFRKLNVCNKYVSNICNDIFKKTNVDIFRYIDVNLLLRYVVSGGVAVSGIGHEIYMNLDSNESWYQLSNTKIQNIYRLLRGYDRNCPKAYMFTYNIANIGVIKDVSEDVVRIVNKLKD